VVGGPSEVETFWKDFLRKLAPARLRHRRREATDLALKVGRKPDNHVRF